MHQSIPAVPIPPPPWATAGHLLTLSVPGVGHSQFYHGPGTGHIKYPGATPGHLTHMFLKVPWMSSAEKTGCLWSNGLSVKD